MGGDLNLKKSWHPLLMSNQKKVWEEEKKALEERKRIDQMMKERAEERQIQELQELQESAGGTKRQARVDWMYSGPSGGQVGTTEEMEGFLLGKRRIDGLLKGNDNQKLEKSSKEDSFMAVQNANTLRDTASKIRDDPMLAIRKQEQAAREAIMNDLVKKRMLVQAEGKPDSRSAEREHKRRKHHHHHTSDESRSRHNSRRYEDGDERRSKHRSQKYEYDDERRERRHHHRRRISYSSDESSSPSRQKSLRSPSPRRQRRSGSPDHRDRSKSPYRRHKDLHELRKTKSWHSARVEQRHERYPRRRSSPAPKEDMRAARLVAMQQAASKLDADREQRLNAIGIREKAEYERDDASRSRNARYGGRADFVNGLHRQAGNLDLADRVGRGKAGMEREQEAY